MAAQRPKYSAPRTDFGEPPPGYVPGIGRGATGFTTRSDIGPAGKAAPERGAMLPPGLAARKPAVQQQQHKEHSYDDSQFDKFSGFQENLFGDVPYTQEDLEYDQLYQAIDERVESRRKLNSAKTGGKPGEEKKPRAPDGNDEPPKIADQFRELKRKLAEVTEEEWDNLPDAMDLSRQNRLKKTREVYVPVPDSVQFGAASVLGGTVGQLDARTMLQGGSMGGTSGLETPMMHGGIQTPMAGPTDLTTLGRARDRALGLKLDSAADSVQGQTVVDPKGYLTDLQSIAGANTADRISDQKKARLLLKSVITTNPKHAPGWIAAARLEQETGNMGAARKLILKGCEVCGGHSEDVWLEAVHMHPPHQARGIIAEAVAKLPRSVQLWIEAAELESKPEAKKAVLRRALELIPNSVQLWKAAIELEEAEDARVLLGRAVELVPQAVEMWLALARLETYDRARAVLNKARKALPTEPQIWIAAARLEEANGNLANIAPIVGKAVGSLAAQNAVLDRETWLGFAEQAEKTGGPATCQALVEASLGLGVEDADRRHTWLADVDRFVANGAVACARAALRHILKVFPSKKSIWLKAAHLERQYGGPDELQAILAKAVEYCPTAEELWLLAAREKWQAGDVDGAREVLGSAFQANPNSENIWLAAVKLECECQETERARALLQRAVERAPSARVYMKLAKLERTLGNTEEERSLLLRGVQLYPDYARLWLMLGQLQEREGKLAEARATFRKAARACPNSELVWLCAAGLETRAGALAAARAVLESARARLPKSERLWLAAIRLELMGPAPNPGAAGLLLARGLQEIPNSGLLHAESIRIEANPKKRKDRCRTALNACPEDAHVLMAAAIVLWMNRKSKEARSWFGRAVAADPDLGDAWAAYYAFERASKKPDLAEAVRKRCVEAEPRHGERWCAVSKRDSIVSPKVADVLEEVASSNKWVFD